MDVKPEDTKEIKETSYENYNASSFNYDSQRTPLGLTEMKAAFQKHGFTHLQAIADIGCGTGNYLISLSSFYDKGVGVDINEGMIKQFDLKIQEKKLTEKIKTIQAPGQAIPCEDSSFDGVIACLTIHHHGSLENKQKFMNEVARILKPGGVFVINHNADVHFDSLWYVAENERVRNLMKEKAGSREELLELGKNAGLEFKEKIPIFEEVIKNSEILLTPEGRSTASVFALFNEAQIQQFEKAMKERMEKGVFKTWTKEVCASNIEKYGITAHYVFKKAE